MEEEEEGGLANSSVHMQENWENEQTCCFSHEGIVMHNSPEIIQSCAFGCVLHSQACFKRTRRVRITQELYVWVVSAVSRRQASPRPHTVSHTLMLRLGGQLAKYPATNKKHQKP